MRKRNIIVKLLLVGIITSLCVWALPDRAESRDPDRRGHDQRRGKDHDRQEAEQIRMIESLDRMVEVHERMAEIFDDAPISGLMAINSIKDIAVKSKRIDQGINALDKIADDSPVQGLRHAALMSLHELYLADKKPDAAMKALMRICLEFDDEDDDDEDDEDDDDDDN